MPMPDTSAFISRLLLLTGFDSKLSVTQEDVAYIPLVDLHDERDELLEWEVADPGDDDTLPLTPCMSEKSFGKMLESSPPPDKEEGDINEWYGLEYSLRLSVSESHGSGAQTEFSEGEASKSRQSFSITQDGEVSEQGSAEWQHWRRHLDYRRAWAFLALSRKRSQAFVENVWAWDTFYHQLKTSGTVDSSVLSTLHDAPPDPYLPPRKKNYAWYLKRTRSFGSLQELGRLTHA
ncbi:hypothetical protein CYLTODRAFT_441041 [Cylindrobasidium torrendii FP15055 ss-10]|uniref:Uncharacterized protein n=1 Tax=Cylindrobasidium torrendii FP15055 ss-10 TaxID=1314674 RepID=A0A0D7BMX5_9AGAR|nr:hypothetical protein CYLTODRAFT_441041 [Cylindrobasidium torrendii FP15055 ss-10]